MNRKRDANEKQICKVLRTFGAVVYPIECRTIAGAPDLLVFYRDKVFALEVKTTDGKISQAQRMNTAVQFVRTPTDALHAVGINI